MSPTLPRRRLLQAALATPLAAPAQASVPTPAPTLAALLTQRLRAQPLVGLAAARVRSNLPPELASAGLTQLGGRAIDVQRDRFEIGSISKTFVGLLLADAVQRGELKLEGAVEDVLGQRLRDAQGQPLRWVDLATHRSGLPRLAANLGDSLADPYADYSEAHLLQALREWQPSAARDAAFEYSNFGFGLLAWAVARRVGKPLEQLWRERVLQPLGLGDGVIALKGTARGALLQGHDGSGTAAAPWHFSPATAGAGALRCTLLELVRYAQCALGQAAHPLREAFALALQPHSAMGPQRNTRMGLGWILTERQGRPVATHDGGTAGFSSTLWLDLSRGAAGLGLSNSSLPLDDLGRHLMDASLPQRDWRAEREAAERQRAAPALSLTAEQLAPLAGVYDAGGLAVTVRVRGNQLFSQATGQGEFELFASAPREFFARVASLSLRFEGSQGVPPAFELLQNGQRTRFVRTGDEPSAAQGPILSPAQLQLLSGRYVLNASFALDIRSREGRLFAQATGQGEFELFALSPRRFMARITPLEISFEGESGVPPALLLQQAGRQMRFLRD